ncbi:MAG: PIN domain-containing protein [Defluviitaleaceae bacterium]|nr:PIN domain-containing protein [Defluviitaleaceae bacterium]
MVLIDANVILRHVLKDNVEMAQQVEDLLKTNKVYAGLEVIAEVVYVLEKVYKVERNDIVNTLRVFFSHSSISVESNEVLDISFSLFDAGKFDFVDTVLYAKNRVYGYDVFTFDKKLNAVLQSRITEE